MQPIGSDTRHKIYINSHEYADSEGYPVLPICKYEMDGSRISRSSDIVHGVDMEVVACTTTLETMCDSIRLTIGNEMIERFPWWLHVFMLLANKNPVFIGRNNNNAFTLRYDNRMVRRDRINVVVPYRIGSGGRSEGYLPRICLSFQDVHFVISGGTGAETSTKCTQVGTDMRSKDRVAFVSGTHHVECDTTSSYGTLTRTSNVIQLTESSDVDMPCYAVILYITQPPMLDELPFTHAVVALDGGDFTQFSAAEMASRETWKMAGFRRDPGHGRERVAFCFPFAARGSDWSLKLWRHRAATLTLHGLHNEATVRYGLLCTRTIFIRDGTLTCFPNAPKAEEAA